jgi:hypothetical protein
VSQRGKEESSSAFLGSCWEDRRASGIKLFLLLHTVKKGQSMFRVSASRSSKSSPKAANSLASPSASLEGSRQIVPVPVPRDLEYSFPASYEID